ncbi:nucleotidyl transferase AbiEii/AbiGii toxin family protein [Spirosoma sp. HMF4905]|uniref:Nucleotidyl transferase AbiEii/AbiGii toxin family protein n=1 Tax=Spirosoma arboris TaxID=2682092 RepID=A0A7K1SF53_9BACT|nr:nucleotidyl transferase AbiEii/AbiGii toxin family protein [Spirosoma arboris]MVM32447.1 nucleotidyl transferase AbiEii/AbiGii toxin family protein [Spirosoma arboris]
MKLHENPELFADAVTITAQQMNLPEIYIEKDYWVTLALQRIFTGPLAECTVFKGGTALSKCFSFINRFSEDIDLVLLKDPSLSANQLKERLKCISNAVSEFLPEMDVTGITNKKGMIRKTAHSYSRLFTGEFGQVRDMIIVESSWLGSSEPVTTGHVSSFIYQMMQASGQNELAVAYNLLPFEVALLAPTRTLCEKIMSLVRFSYTDRPIVDLRNKIRHVYDLHQLLQQTDLSVFFDSEAFDAMLHKVGRDDEISFRNNKDWLYHHPAQALLFADLDRVWPELRSTYHGSFKNLVFGQLPVDEGVFQTLKRIEKRLLLMNWTF